MFGGKSGISAREAAPYEAAPVPVAIQWRVQAPESKTFVEESGWSEEPSTTRAEVGGLASPVSDAALERGVGSLRVRSR